MFKFKSSLNTQGKATGRETWKGPEMDDGVPIEKKQEYGNWYRETYNKVVPTEREEGFRREQQNPFLPGGGKIGGTSTRRKPAKPQQPAPKLLN